MQKKWVVSGVVALLAAAGGAAWFTGVLPGRAAAKAQTEAKAPGKDGKPEVALEFTGAEVVQPAIARLPALIEFSGPLIAPQTAIVRAKSSGTLLALAVAEGSRVTAGQALGRVDLAELSSRVAERGANLESARATLAQAERTHQSNERLAQQQFISSIALDNSRAAVETARAAFNAAQAALETTRVTMRDASLVAPISGIVAKRHAVPGEKLTAEQQVLTIVDLAKLELAGTVGTHEVSRLSPGMAVEVNVEGVGKPVAGRIARIAPAAEPGTRSIGVTIELANPQETLRAGQYAVARAVLPDDAERLTVPLAAVGNTSGQDHVWLIADGVLVRRAITLGRKDTREGRVEIVTGLVPGSQVLAARFDNLREGAKASVVATKSAPVASAAASTPANLK
jgi:membrane fusion protein (multidrug efflux system)